VLLATLAVWPGHALGQPARGPHETVDFRFTTTRPNAPSGWRFRATYHAAGDPQGNPPYMRKMAFYHPRGMRFDTTVPARCSASDAELAVNGPQSCPADSRLGTGTVVTSFLGSYPSASNVELFNGPDQQVIVARTPGTWTIVRSRMHPDGSVEYASPTCWPNFGSAPCAVDNALQMMSSISVPPFTRSSGGQLRSYLTTPSRCPARGYWKTPIRWWWSDGSSETVVTRQPCRRGQPARS
jgi:hypothetical protein